MREFGLIGRSLAHSFSPAYFAAKFAALGLVDHRYAPFELESITELPALLAAHPRLAGLNVTIPYKEDVRAYLDELAPTARRVGAVNTIAFASDGRRIGHNTDLTGFDTALTEFFALAATRVPPPARALILGRGGAAKAVEVALKARGIPYLFVTRNPLAAGLAYTELSASILRHHRLIINTTPVGTWPDVDACPDLPYAALTPAHFLFDLVYNPVETEFMRRGQAAGATTCNGQRMLELQADAAWQIWNNEQ
ncbi:MAG: shikimate dehydrogenase [Hymenobacteraceae bacterium]|nr:shikimate dehydrogenase [Hymenobacteraceae bacterium]